MSVRVSRRQVLARARKLEPSCHHALDGRGIMVFDQVFPEDYVEELGVFLQTLEYEVKPSFDRELLYAFDNDVIYKMPQLMSTVDILVERFYRRLSKRRAPQELSHGYAAAMRYGDDPMVHRDIDCGDCLSLLYYGNLHWSPAWAGETVFFDEARDARFAVAPRAGRLVLFNANLLHRTGVPSKNCPTFRYALALFLRCAERAPKL